MPTRQGKLNLLSEQELRRTLDGAPNDQRKHARIPKELRVEVPLSWEQLRLAYTLNISKGGLSFTIEGPASLPAALELVLALPNGDEVALNCEVRHVVPKEGKKEYEVGVQFKALDPSSQGILEAAIAGLTH